MQPTNFQFVINLKTAKALAFVSKAEMDQTSCDVRF